MAPRKSPQSRSSVPHVRQRPLADEKLEAFVIAFRDSFEGPAAARAAGYDDPDQIWRELLAIEDVKERLRGYQPGTDAPAPSAASIGKHLYANLVKTNRSMISRDIVTGAVCLDLGKALAESPFVTVEQTIEERGGITHRRTRLRKTDPIGILNILISKPELLDMVPGALVNPLEEAFKQIARRGSKAPIAEFDLEKFPPPAKEA